MSAWYVQDPSGESFFHVYTNVTAMISTVHSSWCHRTKWGIFLSRLHQRDGNDKHSAFFMVSQNQSGESFSHVYTNVLTRRAQCIILHGVTEPSGESFFHVYTNVLAETSTVYYSSWCHRNQEQNQRQRLRHQWTYPWNCSPSWSDPSWQVTWGLGTN